MSLNDYDLEKGVTDNKARILQIIYAAMLVGVGIFFLVIIFLYNRGQVPESHYDEGMLDLFGLVLVMLCGGAYSIAYMLPQFLLKPDKLKVQLAGHMHSPDHKQIIDPVDKLLMILRQFLIARIALIEGPALFGLVFLFMSVTNGAIYTGSKYWFFAAPAVVLFGYILKNFPTKQQHIDSIKNYILNKIRTV